jgi:hypothetical protein
MITRHRLFAACVAALTAVAITFAGSTRAADRTVDFNRDVQPILAKHCFTCHGPDENAREAGLRLDTQEGSREDFGGYRPIEPGSADDSEVFLRISSDDPGMRMPPADKHPPLSAAEIDTIRRWIESGAEYRQHWSFRPATLPPIPNVSDPQWCNGPIDRFVLHRMQQAGLSPSPPADREALIRRVHLDLLGTVPTPDVVDRFLADDRPGAYERLVDRLLASPEYGERFARRWLDLARYSDTNGYEKDRPRTIWPYRDWVINAINADKPFDEFSIEQLAGDMLPGATRQQRIATGFHRNTMLNEEGGIDPLEYRFHAMVDRVATTGTVWMGLTIGCAQCHTHKYDPITHTDYYGMMALMNNADEPELNADPPAVIEKRQTLERQIEEKQQEIADRVILSDGADPSIRAAYADWKDQLKQSVSRWETVAPTAMESTMPRLVVQRDGSVLASGDATKRDVYTLTMPPIESAAPVTAIRLEALTHASLPATGPGLAYYEGRRGDFFLSEVDVSIDGEAVELVAGTTSVSGAGPKNGKTYPGNVLDGDGSTGWSIPGQAGQVHRLVIPLKEPRNLDQPWTLEMLFERHYVAGLGHFRIDVTGDEKPAAVSLPSDLQRSFAEAVENESVDADLETRLAIAFLETAGVMAPFRKEIQALKRQLPEDVRTLVMRERDPANPRTTHRHHRGEYLQPKEVVDPAVPELFASDSDRQPSDRLELAKWLVSDDNPLVGRVTANRAWREFFGHGIVRTDGDFGTQSQPPTHPDLLDYLDVWLRDASPSGGQWSIKRLHRQIVLSSTYRQAVGSAPQQDPENKLLSTFPYRRYNAERIRDAFLSASGLLSRRQGGPSVYPPQPKAVVEIAYGKPAWPTSKGADRFRRSLYTFSKRTAPFAAFTTFDAPSGEVCIARRDSSTTPLQALTLLNDAMYLEIADGLARQSVRDVVGNDASPDDVVANVRPIARRMFRRLLVRQPQPEELDAIVRFYHQQSEHQDPWLLVARALMNTDEAITTP